MSFANWRSGASYDEKHSYNTTDKILLSFDDYADEIQLSNILKILEEKQIKVIFFPIGNWAKNNPSLISEILKKNHWLGNHTASHRNLLKLTDAEIRYEIEGGLFTGLLRPPYGGYNQRIKNIALIMGYKVSFWSIDSEDWKGLSSEKIQQRIFRSLKPGSCVLLHMNAEHTVEALPGIIDGIRSRNFELCSSGDEIIL